MNKLLKKIDKVLPFHIGNVTFFAEFYSVLQKLMYNFYLLRKGGDIFLFFSRKLLTDIFINVIISIQLKGGWFYENGI